MLPWLHGRNPNLRYTPAVPLACIILNNNTVQSIPSGAETVCTLFVGGVLRDPWGMWDGSTKIILPVAGVYCLAAEFGLETNAANFDIYCYIRKNGGADLGRCSWRSPANGANGTTFCTVATIQQLAANDYIELVAFQNSGGALNTGKTSGGTALPTSLQVVQRLL